jgi:hypothetical protein
VQIGGGQDAQTIEPQTTGDAEAIPAGQPVSAAEEAGPTGER